MHIHNHILVTFISVLHYNLNAYMQDIVNPDMSPQLIVTRSRIHLVIWLWKKCRLLLFCFQAI